VSKGEDYSIPSTIEDALVLDGITKVAGKMIYGERRFTINDY